MNDTNRSLNVREIIFKIRVPSFIIYISSFYQVLASSSFSLSIGDVLALRWDREHDMLNSLPFLKF
jgi:hypothetical protein